MSLISYNEYIKSNMRRKKPTKIIDLYGYVATDEVTPDTIPIVNTYTFARSFGTNLNEIETILYDVITENVVGSNYMNFPLLPFYNIPISRINSYIYNNFGNRKLFDKYFKWFKEWDGTTEDYAFLKQQIDIEVVNCFYENKYKWCNLLNSTILEFNPLWNVDGTETTERTLSQDGTVQNEKDGDDKIVKTGYDETHIIEDKDITETGTITDTKTGTVSTTHTGSDTDTSSNTTTESTSFYDTHKTIMQKQTTDTETPNITLTKTPNTSNTEDTETTNTMTYNTEDKTVYNSNDLMTRDLGETETITITRSGNIGVTTTTKLLSEYRDYVDFNLLKIIAHDISNYISEGVY